MAHLFYPLSPEVVAFSTRREGGVSQGAYATFNANPYCGDSPSDVVENRKRLAAELGLDASCLVVPHQVHGIEIAFVQGPCAPEGVDAVVTQTPGLCVCVSTADCIPVLLYDAVHGAVAAIHAGWRGTVADIVGHTVSFMQERCATRPSDLQAVIGPGIGVDAFEVGDEVYQAFCDAGFPMAQTAIRKTKWHIDLWKANEWLLRRAGVGNITMVGICTYHQQDEFFSARRLGIRSGRILNGIFIKKK